MRVLLTGSRDWDDLWAVFDELSLIWRPFWLRHPPGEKFVVVHGACESGADRFASLWVRDRQVQAYPVIEEPHPADWAKYGKGAGPRRNQEMVARGANICLAFIMPCSKQSCRKPKPHDSHGTSGTIDLAWSHDITVKERRK